MRKSMLLTLFLAFLLAATLQVRLTAKTLTEPKEPQAESKAESVAVADEKPPGIFALALALPETNDRERVDKLESLFYLFPWSDDARNRNSQQQANIEKESIRVAESIELSPLRTEKILLLAWRFADDERWNEYSALTDSLDPLFKEMTQAYRLSFDDVKAGRRDAALERLLAFRPRIIAMRQSYASGVATVFCFTALGKLGFTDEVIEQCQLVRASWSLPNLASRFDPQSEEEDYWEDRILEDSFRNAICDVGSYLIRHDDLETALDFACKMYDMGQPYSCVTDSARGIMSTVVDEYVKKGEIDEAMQACTRIVDTLGTSAQWVERPIFQALLERDDFDRALEMTRSIVSSNTLVKNQMYFDLMEYTLKHNDKVKCDELFDEAMEEAAKLERPANRLRNLEYYAKIAVQLNDPAKVDQVLTAAETYRNAALTEKDPQAYNAITAERNKVHVLHDFASVQFHVGKTDDAKMTLQEALRQADNVVDAERSEESLRQKDWAIMGVMRTQVLLGLADDAFKTATLIADKEAITEAYFYLGNGFIYTKDIPSAKKALTLAKERLKEISNSRIFGLVQSLEQRFEIAENESVSFPE